MANTQDPQIVRFFDPAVKAPFDKTESNSTLEDVLSWSDSKLEYRHDYIQHLFPLPERSGVNSFAPVITKQVYEAFRDRPELRQSLRSAYDRMCAFYGFKVDDRLGGSVSLSFAENWQDRVYDSWLTRVDHNHLRISRIIRSLRVLGLNAEAQAFYGYLRSVNDKEGGVVSSNSVMYWARAAELPLYKPPSPRESEVEWLKPEDGPVATV